MDFKDVGKKKGEIKVSISYKIIKLFSAGLYSSPNKAFEELVSNSYDAMATKVAVYVPSSHDENISWVCDNGKGMNSEGLRWLWKIGLTNKREAIKEGDREPIGKFGIGKLATYVLTRRLTYICKNDGKYLLVSMDFDEIEEENSDRAKEIVLEERELTEQEVKTALGGMINKENKDMLGFNLWGKGSEKSWTFAIMSDLREKAREIQEGKLRWILRTALPLSPSFNLLFNGEKLESSKIDSDILNSWIVGKNDSVAKKFKEYSTNKSDGRPSVNLPNIKNVKGKIELFRDSLLKGKSENWGRSHGIFLMVRGRLINLDDPLLGMPAMSHGVFNRIRMIIDADELDEFITSTRESIQESPALQDIRRYLQRKFDEVANYYFNNLTKEQKGIGATVKVSQTPASLSRRPLFTVAKKFFSGEIKKPLTIDLPERLSKKEQDKFLDELEKEVMDKKGIIKEIVWEAISPEGPIGRLNLKTGKVQINLIHPFFANFAENINSSVPFQLIAITEILTEAHLIENGMNQEKVEEIMWFRDQLLRELTFNEKKSAAFVYQMIQASLADPGALEDAVFHAFQTLGFKTTKLGGAGKPDGHGVAPLGFVDGKKKDYSLVYDAKSTKKKKIAAGHARISAIKRHRTDYNSDYAIVVAVDFVGGEDPKSAVSKEAKADNVCLIRARDLMTLVMIATPKQLGYSDFKDLFENNHTVKETSEWIEKAKNRPNRMGPVKELLETTAQLMQEDTEPPEIGSIRIKNEVLRKSSKEDLRNLVISLTRLVPGYISLNGDIISLNVSPEVIMKALSKTADSGLPSDLAEAYSKVFKN